MGWFPVLVVVIWSCGVVDCLVKSTKEPKWEWKKTEPEIQGFVMLMLGLLIFGMALYAGWV